MRWKIFLYYPGGGPNVIRGVLIRGYVWASNWPLYKEGKERPKKEADHSRLVVTGLISKEAYIQGLSWQDE